MLSQSENTHNDEQLSGNSCFPHTLLFSAEEARVLSVGEAPSSTANKLKGVCSLTAVLFANLSCRWAELFGSSSQSRRCDAVSPGRLAGERGRFRKVLSTGSRQKGFVLFLFCFYQIVFLLRNVVYVQEYS